MVKPRLAAASSGEAQRRSADAAIWTLSTVLTEGLKLLHPYMPFITEEIYCTLHPEADTIMTAQWPGERSDWNFPEDEKMVGDFIAIIRGIRNVRMNMNVPASKKTEVFIVGNTPEDTAEYRKIRETFGSLERMAFASAVEVPDTREGIAADAVSVVTSNATTYIPLEELVDKEKEIARLQAESRKMDSEIARCEGMLNNPGFVSKAPEAKVAAERRKLETYRAMKEKLTEQLKAYGA